jgi:hypothetical protein
MNDECGMLKDEWGMGVQSVEYKVQSAECKGMQVEG